MTVGRAHAAPIVRFVDAQYFGLLMPDRRSGAFRIELKDVKAE